MTRPSLYNLTIINTRPAHQAKPLNDLLTQLGATVINLPTLEIAPANAEETKALCSSLNENDIAIFVSANAAHCSHKYWQKPFPCSSIIAIGPGTAKTLEKYQLTNVLLPNQFNSEGVLELEVLKNAKNKRVIIFCGENPRPHLREALVAQGAEVVLCECYERLSAEADSATIQLLQNNSVDAVISTSSESLKSLESLISNHHLRLKSTSIIVISPSMQEHAQQQGWASVILAENASDSAIVQAASKLMRP